MSLTWPVIAKITQQFATNPNSIQPNGHTGIDFATPVGTSVKAAGSGTVVWADWATKLSASNPWWIAPAYAGITVVIDHGNGLLTLYAHLNSTHLNIGNKVAQGQEIGKSGNTGLSTGPHLHFEIIGWPLKPYNNFYGRLNPNLYVKAATPAPAPLKANQRKVGNAAVNMRAEPNTKSKIVRVIKPNTVETFTGYANGERVNGLNLWYKDAQGYAWCGGFTTQTANGLPNQTPAAPKPAPVPAPTPKPAPTPAPAPSLTPSQRKVGASVIRYRKAPNTSAEVIIEYKPGDVLTFDQWTLGEAVDGNNIWFKGAISDGYAWSGGFTDKSTTGLTEEVVSESDSTKPTPTPVVEKYSFTPDFDFVEYIPAAISNFQKGNFPDKPEYTAIHQFGTLGVDTLNSTINTFTNPNMERKASSHFVVSGKRIIQMVSLKDRAYHAGSVGNNYVGIETDPAQDADTIASTKKLLAALKAKYGYELKKTLHKDIPGNSTNCGAAITLSKYNLDTPIIVVPVPTPPTEPTPTDIPETPVVVVPTPAPVDNSEEIIDEFLAEFRKVLLLLRK